MSLLLDTVVKAGPHAGSTMRECIERDIRVPIEPHMLERVSDNWETMFSLAKPDATDDAQESAR
jgi:hypothetical protein